ncbi:MAG: FAD-dependent oxidoreductase, partial [Treponema sp.]|nr:FAD-dependent oxidoreductase [Treponema sp.]
LMSACATSGSSGGKEKLTPGTYTAKASGFQTEAYDVRVVVAEDKILDITWDGLMDSPYLGQAAVPLLKDRILAAQTSGVDGISGATITSTGFKAAVTAALEQAGARASSVYTQTPRAPSRTGETQTVDVLVIGGGAAGFSAAVEAKAANQAATVTLIEKRDLVGGSTITSAGIVYAALDAGDVPVMKDYYLHRAQGYADETLLQYFAEHSRENLDFLGADNFIPLGPAGTANEPRANMIMNPPAGLIQGAGMIQILQDKARAAGVTVETGVRAVELLKNGEGAVVQVRAESKTKNITFKVKKGVVIATGGFDSDREGLMKEHNPDSMYDIPRSSHGNVGEGIKMGVAAGAATVFKGGKIGWAIIDPAVDVDVMDGFRIVDKTGILISLDPPAAGTAPDGTSLKAVSYARDPRTDTQDYPPMFSGIQKARTDARDKTFWYIFNETQAPPSSLTSADLYTKEWLISHGYAREFDSVAELAAWTKTDPAKLSASFNERYPGAVKFGAAKVQPSSIGSMGGLKINVKGEVQKAGGGSIPGLYAAGETANGDFYYKEYPASGSSLSLAIVYGRAAGGNAATAPDHALLP